MRNPLKIIWIVLGFICLGLGTIGVVLLNFADSSVLYGNIILFCKEFRKIASMVYRNKTIQKTFG